MIFLKNVWLIASILNFAAFIYIIFDGARRFKKENPNIRLKKPSVSGLIFALVRIIIISILPAIHLLLLIAFIFGYEAIMEKVMEILEEQEI